MKYPIRTPWGPRDSITEYAEGVAFVGTASHGGFVVHESVSLSDAAKRRAIFVVNEYGSSWYFFEEDCDASIAAFELPMLMAVFPNLDTVHRSLVSWNPDYLMERGIDPTEFHRGAYLLDYISWLERQLMNSRRQAKNPDIVTSRCWEYNEMTVYTVNGDLYTFPDRKTNRANRLMDIRAERVSEGYDPTKADAESASIEELEAAQTLLSGLTE